MTDRSDPPPVRSALGPYRAAGEASALGERRGTYIPQASSWLRRVAFGLGAVIVSLYGLACAAAMAPTAGIATFALGVAALIAGWFAVGMVRDGWTRLRERVELYDGGVVFVRGNVRETLPWTKLRKVSLWQRASYVELVDSDGRGYELNPGLNDRGHILLRAARVAVSTECERVLDEIRRGKSHEISSIEITADGLHWDSTSHFANPSGSVNWADLRDVRIDWPELLLTPRAGRTYRFVLPYMSRWALLLALVESLRPRNT